MEKRPLDTELEVLWSEHLEDDVFSVRAYNVLAHRLGLRTLGDILNLTRDDIAKARGAGKKTLDDIAKLVRSCGYELNGFTDAGPNCKKCKQRDFLRPAHQHFLKLAREFNRSYHHPKDRACVFPSGPYSPPITCRALPLCQTGRRRKSMNLRWVSRIFCSNSCGTGQKNTNGAIFERRK